MPEVWTPPDYAKPTNWEPPDFAISHDRTVSPSFKEAVGNVPFSQYGQSKEPITDEPAQHEPDTYWGGFLKGVNDYLTDMGKGMFESSAHPQTTGDILGLMIPSKGPGLGANFKTKINPKVAESIGATELPAPNPAEVPREWVPVGEEPEWKPPAFAEPVDYNKVKTQMGGKKTTPDHAEAEADNMLHNSSFGYGHILPEGLPTEYRDRFIPEEPKLNYPVPETEQARPLGARPSTLGQVAEPNQMLSEEPPQPKRSYADFRSASEKIKAALSSAIPAREEQEALYSQERAKRFGEFESQPITDQASARAAMGKLKGSLPKVALPDFQLQQPEVDTLYAGIGESKYLTAPEKAHAIDGLTNLLAGETPQRSQISLLSQVFGPDFGQLIEMHGGLGGIKGLRLTSEAVNLPKSLMASMDMSAPFRQGLPLVHTKEFWNSFATMFKVVGDEKAYNQVMQTIRDRPKYILSKLAGVKYTGADFDITRREEQFMSQWAETGEMLPGKPLQAAYKNTVGAVVRASDRAYTGFLNKLRADTFDRMVDDLSKAYGTSITYDAEGNAKATKAIRDIGKFVNVSTGRGSLGSLEKMAPELNTVLFSPRMISSRLTMLNPKYYMDLEPMVRKEALKSLFSVAALGSSVSGLAKAAGAEVSLDPTSADFMKIKIGNTRIDPFGGFQQYIVAANRLVHQLSDVTHGVPKNNVFQPSMWDTVENFGVNKLSPVAGFIHKMMTAHNDKTGQLKDRFNNDINLKNEVASRYIPMVLQDIYDVAKDDPKLIPLAAAAGTFGMGVQTYKTKPPKGRFGGFRLNLQ